MNETGLRPSSPPGPDGSVAPMPAPQAEPPPPPAMKSIDSLGFVMDVPVELTVELGRKHARIGEILRLGPGSILELSKANGELRIQFDGAALKGGTLLVMGKPLPNIAFGNLEGLVKIKDGLATLEKFQSKSNDVEVVGAGTIKLASRPDYSELNLTLRFKPEADLIKREALISLISAVAPADPKNPGFKGGRVTGFLGRPNFLPGT